MQQKNTIQLDAALLAGRMRTHRPRPVAQVVSRGNMNHLRKHATSDVWIPNDTKVIRPETPTKKVMPAPVFKSISSDQKRASAAHSELVPSVATIDFAKNAMEWKSQKKTKGRHTPKFNRAKVTNYLLIGMAGFVFMFGVLAALNSFRLDHKIATTVSAQSVNESDVDENAPSDEEVRTYSVAPNMPRIITIPALNETARIRQVGTASDGSLKAPSNIHDAAWYQDSALPGSPGGASVIDAHISGPTQKGAFYNLKNLKKGDQVIVEKGSGEKFTYRVMKTEIHNVSELDMSRLLLPVTEGKHGLNLISCTGTYDTKTKEYNQRVVVFTEVVR